MILQTRVEGSVKVQTRSRGGRGVEMSWLTGTRDGRVDRWWGFAAEGETRGNWFQGEKQIVPNRGVGKEDEEEDKKNG